MLSEKNANLSEKTIVSILQKNITELACLQTVKLNNLGIKYVLPCAFNLIPEVTKLELRSNFIKEIPNSISLLTKLKELDISDNCISKLSFLKNNEIEVLVLGKNRIEPGERLMAVYYCKKLAFIDNRPTGVLRQNLLKLFLDVKLQMKSYLLENKITEEMFKSKQMEKFLVEYCNKLKLSIPLSLKDIMLSEAASEVAFEFLNNGGLFENCKLNKVNAQLLTSSPNTRNKKRTIECMEENTNSLYKSDMLNLNEKINTSIDYASSYDMQDLSKIKTSKIEVQNTSTKKVKTITDSFNDKFFERDKTGADLTPKKRVSFASTVISQKYEGYEKNNNETINKISYESPIRCSPRNLNTLNNNKTIFTNPDSKRVLFMDKKQASVPQMNTDTHHNDSFNNFSQKKETIMEECFVKLPATSPVKFYSSKSIVSPRAYSQTTILDDSPSKNVSIKLEKNVTPMKNVMTDEIQNKKSPRKATRVEESNLILPLATQRQHSILDNITPRKSPRNTAKVAETISIAPSSSGKSLSILDKSLIKSPHKTSGSIFLDNTTVENSQRKTSKVEVADLLESPKKVSTFNNISLRKSPRKIARVEDENVLIPTMSSKKHSIPDNTITMRSSRNCNSSTEEINDIQLETKDDIYSHSTDTLRKSPRKSNSQSNYDSIVFTPGSNLADKEKLYLDMDSLSNLNGIPRNAAATVQDPLSTPIKNLRLDRNNCERTPNKSILKLTPNKIKNIIRNDSPRRLKPEKSELPSFEKGDNELPTYTPNCFLRCHFGDKKAVKMDFQNDDPADNQTNVWAVAFEPDLKDPSKTTNIVATCGGTTVCLIDCSTGLVLKRYQNRKEQFYCLAWTSVDLSCKRAAKRCNILAVSGHNGRLKLLQPDNLVCYSEYGSGRPNKSVTNFFYSCLVFHPLRPTWLFCGSSDTTVTLFDVGVPDATNLKTEIKVICILNTIPSAAIVTMTMVQSSKSNSYYIFAGTEKGCLGWPTDSLLTKKKMNPELNLNLPGENNFVDGLTSIGNDLIVCKVVGDGCIYLFNISNQANSTCQIIGTICWKKSQVDYIGIGANNDLLLTGSDDGTIYFYLTSSIRNSVRQKSKSMIPINYIQPWPVCKISDSSYIDKMGDVLKSNQAPVINNTSISHDSKFIAAVTANNLVCIWKRAD